MAVPTFQEFFRPVLGLALEEPIKLTDCIGEMRGILGLTDEDMSERTGGGTKTRVRDRVEWAGTYLYQAMLVERPQRGFILATDRGRKVYEENPDGITSDVLRQFPEFRAFQERRGQTTITGSTDTEEIESATPVERIESAAAELNADLRYELLDQILRASPEFFEDLIIDLMLKMGYGGTDSGTRLGKTGDGGVDGIIKQDKLGLESIYLQAKRYAQDNSIGAESLRSFSGALDEKRATKGVFVTTSHFSSSAVQHAQNSTRSIVLIDGEQLTQLMVEYDVGVREDQVFRLKRLDEDYFTQ